MKVDVNKIIIETAVVESEEEADSKNVSSDDESVKYSRRSSNESNSSGISNTSTAVDDLNELTNQFDAVLTVNETVNEVKSLKEELKTQLIVAGEDDLQDRQPVKQPPHYVHRSEPYAKPRSVNHFSGGSVLNHSPPEYVPLVLNYAQLPSRSSSASPENIPELVDLNDATLPELDADIVSDFLNNLDLPVGPEPSNFAIPVSIDSFTVRQSTPPYSWSPGSTPSHISEVFSPQSSCISSGDTDASQPIGSPALCDLLSLGPNSLPSTLPNSSDDDEDSNNQEGTNELRNKIDTEFKDIKRHEWIQANTKDVPALINELRKLICKDNRLSDKMLVKIYAIIEAIKKQNGPLRKFFLEENNILSFVAFKNNPLLFKYIVETIHNLRLNLTDLKESPATVLLHVFEQNQDMRHVLKTILSMKNGNNSPIFDLNKVDQYGFTTIHHILNKIKQLEPTKLHNLSLEYFKICLDYEPDFQMTTLADNKTYLHYAIVKDCAPQVVEMILRYCPALAKRKDVNGDCAFRLAANLPENRKEIEEILLQYNAFNNYESKMVFNCF